MVNYCGNCGSRLDEKTGLCPKCDKEKLSNKKRKIPRIPLAYIIVCLILAIALLFFIPKLFPSGGHGEIELYPQMETSYLRAGENLHTLRRS